MSQFRDPGTPTESEQTVPMKAVATEPVPGAATPGSAGPEGTGPAEGPGPDQGERHRPTEESADESEQAAEQAAEPTEEPAEEREQAAEEPEPQPAEPPIAAAEATPAESTSAELTPAAGPTAGAEAGVPVESTAVPTPTPEPEPTRAEPVAEAPAEQPAADAPPAQAPGPLSVVLAMVREAVVVVAIALALSLVIKTFFVQAFFIPSASMENTLLIGDRVLVSKLTPGPFELARGDIVVFEDPGEWLQAPPPRDDGPLRSGVRSVLTFVGLLPADSSDHLIKRVVGLPGDRVECCDDRGRITVNGEPIDEGYVYPGDKPSDEDFSVTVPAGRLWVMGDHRSLSQDSRFHRDENDGTVAVADVVGRAFVVVWPFSQAGGLDRPANTFSGVPER